ncbi:hypothetical protein EDC30_10878 [Paucimonas lemoignei]|uniref:Exo-alpha-sialidase n=1 Tax=Paucimonas lemoignei TaxID=29443 RepID=A0A4R3HTI5_PAULE|nr:sialidase family protein [Paucimonas lemoignei]TCS36014.1 hypothetical protein EDC30_10878 [Paucimonas lemoignei]
MKRMMHGLATAPKFLFCMFMLVTTAMQGALAHEGHAGAAATKRLELGTSAAVDKEGRLWVASKETLDGGEFVVLRRSADLGKTWSKPIKVQNTPEPVSAGGEERPKIAFGPKDEIYVTYTKPVAKPHIGDIRFARSVDGARSFSEPVTVHASRDRIVHAFGSMIVDRAGRIFIVWIDGRDATATRARGESYRGSAIYYAVSSDGGATFKGDYKIADHVCECCRISLALNAQGNPVAMWRHVFEPNARDHAVAELAPDGKAGTAMRATFDDWRIDACPHHGPSLAYAADGTRHQVWFNGKDGDSAGVQYATVAPGQTSIKPVKLGEAQASHADIAVQGKQVAIAWKQFDGQATAIMAKLSADGGATWQSRELVRTAGDSDKPFLIHSPAGILLVWRTNNEGIRVVRTVQEAS